MPDRGLLEVARLAPGVVDGTEPRDLRLENARVLQVTFEVDKNAALAAMPSDVSRPVPCYGRVLACIADGIAFALLMVGSRYRMLPRNVLVQGLVQGDPAEPGAALGGPLAAGTVTIERGATVELVVSSDSGELARGALPEPRTIDPGMLRWDAWLTFRKGGSLLELAPRPELTAATLSKGATVEFRGAWSPFRPLAIISACYGQGSFVLPAATPQESTS